MKINELLAQRPTLSFEIFPPKNKDGDITSIYSTIDQLAELKPDFISVTYGAGGSTTRNTVEIASMIKERWHVESVAHLSCIDATADNLRAVLDQLQEKGIDKATGKVLVEVSPDFYRPTDVVNLWGDPSKAKRELGWNPTKTSFEQLVRIMVDHDMKKVAVERAEEHLKTNLAEYLEKGVVK